MDVDMFGKLKAALDVVQPMDSYPTGLTFRVVRQIQPVLGSPHSTGQARGAEPCTHTLTGQQHSSRLDRATHHKVSHRQPLTGRDGSSSGGREEKGEKDGE